MAPPNFDWEQDGLRKHDFISFNKAILLNLINRINRETAQQTNKPVIEITLEDVCAIFNAEAGLTPGGYVDTTHIHSLGEHGVLPLPKNIDFWVDSAPSWHQPMSVDTNLYYFFSYCASIKNKAFKVIEFLHLYRALFEQEFSKNDRRMQALILAGVIHGYFEVGTYRSKTVPLGYLLDNYRSGTRLAQMMGNTDYDRAGAAILANRERNLLVGMGWATEP